ncbi:MAG: aminotransferase class IV family protein [Bacteroidetes bacterium]|nr:aminotransferase class IV family protein [Bacteroidota bacterium]
MQNNFVNFNGNIIEAGQPIFTASNRAFRYGDAVFETIRLMNGEILFFEKHLARLASSMELLGMNGHDDLTFHNLYLSIRHLDQVNNLKGNGRIRLEVFRNDGGLYTPQTNNVSYLIEVSALSNRNFRLNETGLKIDLYTDIKKPVSRLSNLKSSNALYYVMAGLYKNKSNSGDCLVLNTDGRIAEAISSNIFLLDDGIFYTPSLDEACVAGVMREVLIAHLKKQGKTVIEKGITVDDLLKADEIFLSDVIHGLRWVGAFRTKRYFNNFSTKLIKELNDLYQIKKV